jgi:squalene-associated FAD-dependent desaturase
MFAQDRARAAHHGSEAAPAADDFALRFHLMPRTVHVIGAGLSGLAAAVRLGERGERVVVHEAAGQAGGRCRSYHDPQLDMMIDNGNHLLLSGNHAALAYLATIGAADRLVGPDAAAFAFIDLATNERWMVRINDGVVPWWLFDANSRPAGTRAGEFLAMAKLLLPTNKPMGAVIACSGPAYDRFLQPLMLAALNCDPKEGSTRLAARIIRETLMLGGKACRPRIARDGLSHALIEPALAYLDTRNVPVRFGKRLRALGLSGGKVETLDFGDETVRLTLGDRAILAVPPMVAASLVPDLVTPTSFRAIVNAHFRLQAAADIPPMIGVLNATTEWIFSYPGRLSTTTSGADRLLDLSREELAATIWKEVAQVAGLPTELPPWQIVRERRATFAATPEQNTRRPGATTAFGNLYLAGDWTDTGLPATIEGAIRSGNRAADLVLR